MFVEPLSDLSQFKARQIVGYKFWILDKLSEQDCDLDYWTKISYHSFYKENGQQSKSI